MNQSDTKNEFSDTVMRELELDKKFAEHIKKISQTETVSYIDEEGYVVRRTPDGVITRVYDKPSVKP
ncbi:hypothetical protein ACO0LF_09545 [Undibacterium sp. Di27W]|uniref:hypothetical protein n=1 Tax=Undibacterium sp. Di27W TaxID=3413036 RepID=UPI003BF1361D